MLIYVCVCAHRYTYKRGMLATIICFTYYESTVVFYTDGNLDIFDMCYGNPIVKKM